MDDRQENLLALEAVLTPLDARLVKAQSGEQALKAVLAEDFAAILLDVQMPGIDGFETAALIRSRERSAATPIIFLTALSKDVEHVARGYEAGAVDYVMKPFDPLVLRSKVAVFCDLDRQRHEVRAARERLVAEQAARAEAEALAARLAAVAAITEGLDDLSLASLVPTLCRRLRTVLAATGAAVEVRDEDGRVVQSSREGAPIEEALLQRAIAEGGLCADARTGSVAVALRVDGRLLGVVGLSGAPADAHDPKRTGLLRHAAERAALIIERGRLYDRERAIAAALQRDLLPDRLPEVPGVSVAAYLAAGQDGAEVGGDWYDALVLPGGRLGIVVGDVAGRGVAAAARMGQLRSVARAYALEGHAPRELAMRLNAYHLALGAETMTTLLYAVVEPHREQLRFVSAGHLPPVVQAPGEAPRAVGECAGPPLGVLDVCRYREVTVPFPAGSVLALCTDGLIERRGEPVDRGLGRLTEAIAAGPTDDVEAVKARVLATCLPADAVDDDVTAVVVRSEELLGPRAHIVLTPDPEALGAVRRMVGRWLREQGATATEAGEVVMAANEAWQNAIEHGNAFAMVPIDIDLAAETDGVRVVVRDLGHDEGRTPDPDRGRGIALMEALVDEARVDLGGPFGGTVTLRRRLAGRRATAGRVGAAVRVAAEA